MEINYQTQYIEEFIKKNKLTKKEFARKAEISDYMLNQILNKKSVGSRFLVKVLKTINLSSDKFLLVKK